MAYGPFMSNTNTAAAVTVQPTCYACNAAPTGIRVYPRTENKRADLACAIHANVKVPAPRKR